ncbi:hypothetical protein ACROYT_G020146 [Oculina patagonica]
MRVPYISCLVLVVLTGNFDFIDGTSPFFAKSTVTASSQLSPMYSAAHAAMSSSSAWCPQKNFTDNEYLQFDFGEKKVVKHIVTAAEANPAVNQTARSVTKYLIQVSADGVTYEDFESISSNNVTLQIRTQYVRIVPLDFVRFPCMRIEISGCKYINECDTNNGNCDQICENSPGSYECKCRSGFSLGADKHKCNDVDECQTNRGGCNQICKNSYGSYHCECNIGYKLSQDNHTCLDIDECAVNNGGCSYGCQNLQGRYLCTCPHGFELDETKKNCQDTNECHLANGGCETNCHNTNGSYYCSCAAGFELYDKLKCRDIDECSRGSDQCNATSTSCRNFQGGYECTCQSGYKHIQGDNFNCELIACPPLVEAQGTTVSPRECLVVDGRKVNDTCTFSCQAGYKLPDPQTDTLTCLATGGWDVALISCQRMSCPALPPISNGGLFPAFCSISGNFFDETCHYRCDSGYALNGQSSRKCQADGQWDVQAIPTCGKEYPKPWITCPSDVLVTLAPNMKDYDITGLLEDPQSNVQNIQLYPEKYRSQLVFPYGVTVLTYVASNEIGVTANCTTDVTVQDKQAPTIVFCPGNIYEAITSIEAAITWKEPEFSDNIKVERVTSTKQSGDTFPLGSTTVKYDAYDDSGNSASCSFVVNLKRKQCVIPDNPDNGQLSCQSFGDFKYCQILCDTANGKQLFKYTTGSSCNPSTLIWTPSEIPDCVDSVSLPASGVCPTHMIPQPSLISFDNPIKLCVKCPRGMKYDEALKDCVACPVGYISQQESSLTCTQCPPDQSTLKEGSKTCVDLCAKGTSSVDGFNTPENQGCILCSVGFYQDQVGATECKQCPNGYTTIATGSTSQGDCGMTPTVSSFGPPSKVVNATENSRVEFECMAAGPPTPTFLVKKIKPTPDGFGGPVRVEYITSGSVTTGVRYIILSVTEHDAGLYSCTATNKFGSDTKHLTLNVKLEFGGSGSGAGQ